MTSTAIYRAVMLAVERRRLELGLPLWKVDDMAGTQDGYLSKMLYPDAPNGRQARWDTLQLVVEALYPEGFDVEIKPTSEALLTALSSQRGGNANALMVRHWRHTRHFKNLGAKGGRKAAENLGETRRVRRASRAAQVRWRKWRAKQREQQRGAE